MVHDLLSSSLVHLAAIVGVAALMFRDPLLLRSFLIASTLLYIVYYLAVPAEPLWGAIAWSVVMIAVNAAMMLRILYGRTQFQQSEDDARLFAAFGTLTPGEFRSLMRLAVWRHAGAQQILTREGAPLDQLYYVLDGAIGLSKKGRSFPIGSGTFIGEIAFLRAGPASATVTIEPGARYVEWKADALRVLLARNPALRSAVVGLFNADMALKVATAGDRIAASA